MKNHFNDLIRAFDKRKLHVNPNLYENFKESVFIKMLNDSKTKCMCFDGGNYEDLYHKSKVIPDINIPPFNHVWLEFNTEFHDGEQFRQCYLITKLTDGYNVYAFLNARDKWIITRQLKCFGNEYEIIYGENESEMEQNSFEEDAYLIGAFFSALNCRNIKKVEHKPSIVRQAMKKKGKQPLYSTWTLEIDLNKSSEKGQYLGGTHASPRVHLRRGHARQYSPGKYTWVQPCAVGNKSLGMIDKDYAVAL